MKVMMECNIILDRAYSCRELVTTTKEHYERYLKPFCKVLERDKETVKVEATEPVQETNQPNETVEIIEKPVEEKVEEHAEDPIELVEKATESPKNKMSHSGKKK